MATKKQQLEDALAQAAEDLVREAELLEARKKELASDIIGELERTAESYVSDREQISARMLEDLRQFHGSPHSYVNPDKPFDSRRQRKDLRVNITRNKCLIAMGQMGDLQFPARDKNFRITYTPVPSLVKAAINENPEVADKATSEIEEANLAADKMERTIWDQLEASKWGPESRDAIRDLVVLGTAIMKGPIVEGRLKKKWRKDITEDGVTVHLFDYEPERNPATKRVDPFYFFPNLQCKKAHECPKSFELHPFHSKDVAQLAVHPYFDKDEISELLKEKPAPLSSTYLTARNAITSSDYNLKDQYYVWEYHGKLDDRLVEAFGLDTSEDQSLKNPIKGYFGEIWFCQGHMLKARLSHLEGDTSIPYVWTQWEEDETTPFGFGIPALVRDAQQVANATWRMILDNSGFSAGPQVVINKEHIKPANGKWEIESQKVWYATEWATKPEDAIYFFTIENESNKLIPVLDMALKFSDSESSMPLIAQGEESALAGSTATGLALLLSTSNVVQKRANRNWDDDITVPLIDRFYMWNMLYNEDDTIKGDYDVVALGSTDLTARQLESQDADILLRRIKEDPDIKAVVNVQELARVVVSSMHLPTDRILLSPDQVVQNQQNQPPDPQAQLESAKLEIDAAKLQLQQQKLELDKQFREAELLLKTKEVELKERSIQNEWEQYVIQAQATLIREQNEREQELIKLASKEDISVRELLARVGMQEKQEETKRVLGLTDFAIRRMREKREERELDARIRNMTAKSRGDFDSFG